MKYVSLLAAIDEANRFLTKAKELVAAHKKAGIGDHSDKPGAYMLYNPKEQGAVRRASMDLTRALAQLRRSS